MVIYHSQFLPHLASPSAPLAVLLFRNEFQWSLLHEEAFQQVKHLANKISRLRPIDYQSLHPICLFTAGSKFGAGASIGQGPSLERAYPAVFHSRKLATSQLHYPVHELEVRAIVDAVRSFHPILFGTRFTVVTDNKAVSFFLSQTNLPYHQTRWSIFLQSYDFDIIHKPAKDDVLADTLARIYEKQEASSDMILVDPTEKKAIKGSYSAMTERVKQNLYLAHTLDPVKEPCFFSLTPLDFFSIPQHLSMWNAEDVPIADSSKEKENHHHLGPFEHGLHKMAPTLEDGINVRQSNKATSQGQPHDSTETRILIQEAQSPLRALASRIHNHSNWMKQSLHLKVITNSFEGIHDSINKQKSMALPSS